MHGGIVALMLDQVLGNAAHSIGLPASYTRELTITYDAATPLDRPVRVVGRIDRVEGGGRVHIEDIQDQVELALMRAEEQKVARAYVLYREEHARERALYEPVEAHPHLTVNRLVAGPHR